MRKWSQDDSEPADTISSLMKKASQELFAAVASALVKVVGKNQVYEKLVYYIMTRMRQPSLQMTSNFYHVFLAATFLLHWITQTVLHGNIFTPLFLQAASSLFLLLTAYKYLT